ncbi:MAG: response regulator transcription factor [Patescibacteria group bacterium]
MKILLIEDDPEISQLLKASLRAANFTVEIASDGERGSFLARVNKYKLIILDYNLPKMDGLAVCREIRNEDRETPIIMLSVRSEIKDKLDLFQAGVDDYLSKPFSFSELLARIQAILRRPRKRQDEMIRVQDIELNLDTNIVKQGGKEIYLGNKEFALLRYLLERPSQLISREMIREEVWGDNCDPFSNTIETHILKLRRKLDRGHRLITTIPGRGYRLNSDI